MGDVSPFAGLSRHQVLRLVREADGLPRLRDWGGRVLERAHRTDPAGTGSLNDIEHFVLLMQENRSFDHYFGTMSGVRGFGDSSAAAQAFRQFGYAPGVGVTQTGYLNPFRLDTRRGGDARRGCDQ